MKKIAIVVDRYGLEVNGGAEQHARRIAERLIPKYEVEVITTTAIEYQKWDNYFPVGLVMVNNVPVRRFPVAIQRNSEAMWKAVNELEHSEQAELFDGKSQEFIVNQGPYSPLLIEYIHKNKEKFSAFLFVTYLFYPTVMGLPEVADKAIFLPTAHDERILYLSFFQQLFNMPRDFLFNTAEEARLVHKVFNNEGIRFAVVGEGIDVPPSFFPDRFKCVNGLDEYIIYLGRIDNAKQCDQLIEWFVHYKKRNSNHIKLVLVGKNENLNILDPDIIEIGFISDQEKFDALAGAKILIMPSRYESLCMAVLEALSVGTPVLVNRNCEVTRNHCIRGNCGLYYSNYIEFEACLNRLLSSPSLCRKLGENGKKYVQNYYNWNITLNRIDEIMRDY